jgi:hypothetical protein
MPNLEITGRGLCNRVASNLTPPGSGRTLAMRIPLVILGLALSLGGCGVPHARAEGPAPYRIVFDNRVQWTEGHEGFDPDLPGYHVTGDIARLILHPTNHPPPPTLVLAITPSPGMRPMLERFQVATADVEIDTTSVEVVRVESVRDRRTGFTHEVQKGTYFTFEVVGQAVRVTLLPEALRRLDGALHISWIDWYRK